MDEIQKNPAITDGIFILFTGRDFESSNRRAAWIHGKGFP